MVAGKHCRTEKKKIMMAIYAAIIYQIWYARNVKNFQGKNLHIELVMQQVKDVIRVRLELLLPTKLGRQNAYLIQTICN